MLSTIIKRGAMKRIGLLAAASVVGATTILLGSGSAAAAGGPIPIGGGSGILITHGSNYTNACTVATIGHDAAGDLVGLTGARCGGAGQRVLSEVWQDRGRIGVITYSNPVLNYAVIKFDPNVVIPVNSVGGITIRGIDPAPGPGQIVCKTGRTMGTNCAWTWQSDAVGHTTQLCVAPGDTGAPVVAGDRLVGMVTGFAVLACITPETGTNIGTILSNAGRNGSLVGFRPIGT
ncbi:hypothetical protein [Jongsikchunia kroppenstedtii]|uniref:hypothetical protein n=1 Tax=Jongsikchunia kroppenstedtii TaxID=1121721 RepID=UPI00037E9321|nr:hypothetical protein [Jongsikchunia kroppenstedtii]